MSKTQSNTKKPNFLKRLSIGPILIAIGIILCVLPLATNAVFQFQSGQTVSSFENAALEIDSETKETVLEQARAYNAHFGGYADSRVALDVEDIQPYESQLNINGDGMMGWIEIPKADIRASIYHGVEDNVLAMGVGHQSETSLPVGGEYSHCVISGHSGMAQYQVFDNIRVLEAGDVIGIHVLDEVYAYRVTGWKIINPDDFELNYTQGDYITLVTCTTDPDPINPKGRIGVNDKRLLVEAERCEYDPSEFENTSPDVGVYINDFTRPLFIGTGILALCGLIAFLIKKLRARKQVNQ